MTEIRTVVHILCCFVILHNINLVRAQSQNEETFEDIFTTYDKRLRPNALENPVQVNVTAYVLSLEDLDENRHEFTMTLFLRQYWTDVRLRHSASEAGLSTVSLNKEEEKKIWKPDTFIINGKAYEESDSFLKISENGDIVRSAKVTVTASCRMTFGYFPHDRHTCSLDIESYGHPDDEITYSWKTGTGSIQVGDEASPPNFLLGAFNAIESLEITGNYSKISLQVYMIRKMHRNLPTLYFPAMAITLTSFYTLWSGNRQSRIQISVLCLLGIIFLMGMTYTRLPSVAFQTAIEHYYFLCANLILNVVFVNFILNSLLSPRQGYRSPKGDSEMKEMKTNGIHDDIEKSNEEKNYDGPYVTTKFRKFVLTQCKKTKWHLPIAFAIFNVIYMIVVMVAPAGYPEGFTILHNQH